MAGTGTGGGRLVVESGRDDRERIVVGVDGSALASLALRWAHRQAQLTGAVLEAVTAWEYPMLNIEEVALPPHDPETAAARMLAGQVAQTLGPEPEVRVHERAVIGHPSRVLIEAARGAQLLVVGSGGHRAIAAALLGSVAYHCVRHAPCPVVVVREQSDV